MRKKIISAALAGIMVVSMTTLVGCFGDEGGETLREDITHLFVGVYDGGFGADSWNKMEQDFEALYADTSFEEGKMGVDVHITAKKSEYLGDTLKNAMNTNQEDMYFTNIDVRDCVNAGLLVDLTDVVTNTTDSKYAKVYGDNQTIEAKMTDAVKEYIQKSDPRYTADSYKYYGIPVFVSTNSLIYDVDLWEEQSLYFTRDYEENGSDASVVWTSGLEGAPEKGYGQDGIKGTLDDGLPITWDDFKAMLTQIYEESGCTPITFSGGNAMYSREYFVQLYANYEGASDFALNFTYNGVDSELGQITPETGYKVFQQRGREQACVFAEYIATKPGYLSNDALSGASHTDAQDNFLYSGPLKSGSRKRIAMLLEGNWWEHEAQDTINTIANKYSDYSNRRFGVMTFPYMDAQANRDASNKVLVSIQPNSYAVVAKKATAAVQEVAKLFLAFTTSDTYLSYYTSVSGAPRPFKYAVSETDYANMSYYKKSVWEQYKGTLDGSTALLYGRGADGISRYANQYIYDEFGFQGTFGDKSITEPFSGFYYYSASGLTAKKLADIPYEKFSATWKTNYYDQFAK